MGLRRGQLQGWQARQAWIANCKKRMSDQAAEKMEAEKRGAAGFAVSN